MCGICGIVHRDQAYPIGKSVLLAMRDSLTHRGPDDAGDFLAPGVALGSRRLSILDLSERGHMPMSTADGRYWITYNGEVYNYQELRPGLEARGYAFRSNTDTEVVLSLYADEGPAMLDRLNGMFAFAIWDNQERKLFLARDRLGIKPLYYTITDDGAIYFASEEKALFAAGIAARFDPHTWEELLCFRYVSGEQTPFVGVKRLLPGHYLLWKDGPVQIRRWWHLAERAQTLRENLPQDASQWFQETFDSSVNLRRISDVPVGVLLSGGLDSSSIAASLASQAGSGVASFTVRFAETEYDEGPLAREVADRWGLDYHELIVPPDELLIRMRQTAWLNDEPQAHANDTHLSAISQYANPRVTVLLSGEGSDETLGGYVRYQPLRYPMLLNVARPVSPYLVSMLNLNGRWRKLGKFLALGSVERFVLFNTCDAFPADLKLLGMRPTWRFPFREQVLTEAKALYPKEPMRQAMYSDQHTFLCSILDRNDRTTMGASIECRVPFLDYRLVEGLAALPSSILLAGKQSKKLLRQSVGGRLPEAVLRHHKWGFGVPWRHYLRQIPQLRDFVNALPDLKLVQEGPFERAKVKNVVSEFLKGESHNEELIRQLFMIAVWHESY
ncbi:MAG: asparagine synthase (glutamine-hydrolyzing), partial [Pyrinomonadaceae bacterium]|nr:asparagine synthase (glutamine-hydrolyzing) [Pyrinomonadaceae bacterium]